jgi:hypothetical protein
MKALKCLVCIAILDLDLATAEEMIVLCCVSAVGYRGTSSFVTNTNCVYVSWVADIYFPNQSTTDTVDAHVSHQK